MKILKYVIVLLIIIGLINSFNKRTKDYNEMSKNTIENLKVLYTEKTIENNISYIKGKIENNNETKIKQLDITIILYDKENNIIGYTYDMKQNIKPKEDFEISGTITGLKIDEEKIDHWDIKYTVF